MEDSYIGPVRPMFRLEDEPPRNRKVERLIAGTKTNGMFVDVTKKGIELNAYYSGFERDVKYAVLSKPVIIPWDELDKIKGRINRVKKGGAIKDRVDFDTDPEYLKTLPIVTINGNRYYIDPKKRERRSVEKPEEVWMF